MSHLLWRWQHLRMTVCGKPWCRGGWVLREEGLVSGAKNSAFHLNMKPMFFSLISGCPGCKR